jgi:hypothetical protein
MTSRDEGDWTPATRGFSTTSSSQNNNNNVMTTTTSEAPPVSFSLPPRSRSRQIAVLVGALLVGLMLSVTLGVVLSSRRSSSSSPSDVHDDKDKDLPSIAASSTTTGAIPSPPSQQTESELDDVKRQGKVGGEKVVQQLSCPTELGTSLEFTVGGSSSSAISKETITPENDDKDNDYWIEVTNSLPDTLCTLVQIGTNKQGSFIMPVARSYSGHPWEVVAGKYKDHLILHMDDCHEDHCHIHLNVAVVNNNNNNNNQQQPAVFQLTTFGRPKYSDRDVVARFLEQATFGPTTELIDELTAAMDAYEENNNKKDQDGTTKTTNTVTTGSTSTTTSSLVFAQWMHQQMNESQVPIFSHRALYRRHLNARFPVSSPMGQVTRPCQAGTRYRRHAFTDKDSGQELDLILTQNGTKMVVKVAGQVRTLVQTPLVTWNETLNDITLLNLTEGQHRICWVYYDGERSGLAVEHPDHDRECRIVLFADSDVYEGYDTYWNNPPIKGIDILAEYSQNLTVLTIPLDAASVLDEALYPLQEEETPDQLEIILLANLDDADCANLKPSDTDHPVLALWSKWLVV